VKTRHPRVDLTGAVTLQLMTASVVQTVGAVAAIASTLATLVLAFFTWRLARQTATMAKATQDEALAVSVQGDAVQLQAAATQQQAGAVAAQASAAAEQLTLTRQALQASIQPWLTIPKRVREPDSMRFGHVIQVINRPDDADVYIMLSLSNVGNGLAVVDAQRSVVSGWSSANDDLRPFVSGRCDNPVVPPGADTQLVFTIKLVSADWTLKNADTLTRREQGYEGEFYADVVYGDALGLADTRAHAHVAYDKSAWVPVTIEYFKPAASESPDVTVRF
jgi:hypothetical protein